MSRSREMLRYQAEQAGWTLQKGEIFGGDAWERTVEVGPKFAAMIATLKPEAQWVPRERVSVWYTLAGAVHSACLHGPGQQSLLQGNFVGLPKRQAVGTGKREQVVQWLATPAEVTQ